MRWPIVLCAIAGLMQPASGAGRVGEFVESYLKKKQIPGCAVVLRQDEKTVLCAGYGMANLEHNVPVTPQTVFQSGSLGKQFTAMAVLLLVRDRKLALDDTLEKHLPVPKSWSGITVRHLLNHTSGLGDYPESLSLQRDYSEDELLQMVIAQPPQFAPGEKASYSNLGYVTVGILIHKVSGLSYPEFLRERIFQPLGMRNSRVISEEDVIPHRAAGYRLKNGVLQNQEWVAPSLNTTADGSLYFTAEDMGRRHEALDEEKLITNASYKEMWTPAKLADKSPAPYSFGWGIAKTNTGHRIYEHGGAWQGFAAYTARYPDDHLSIAVFCNRAGGSARYISHCIVGFYVPELAPRQHSAAALGANILRSYAGKYRMEDRFTITVEALSDHLESTWLGQKMTMVPESETSFFEPDSDRTFRFQKNDQGKVSALSIFVPEELTLRRLEEPN